MKLTKKEIKKFQRYIFCWWKIHKRDFPWRHTRDPYKILVSEVMLQQTQVFRVLPKYDELLMEFPTVNHLAAASPADVLKVWKGMGYNRRALYLKKAAQNIVDQYGGDFPKSEQELIKLPGLGRYTARAILVFAYKKQVAMVDTNIRHIITHFFFEDIPQKESIVQTIAEQLVPAGKSWEWHQALMDYGAIAMSKLQTKQVASSKKSIPFKQTNRFYRGRIMDRLREEDITEARLIDEFAKKYKKPENFIELILDGLEADGLISRSKTGIISLPE